MSLETPIRLSNNAYYYHGDIWTLEELKERWGLSPESCVNQPQPQAVSSS